MTGNQSSENRGCRAGRPRKGDIWGIEKDWKEAITVQISANPVRQSRIRQQGCNEKFEEDRETGSAQKMEGKEYRVFFKQKQQEVGMEKNSKGHAVHPLPKAELVILERITHQFPSGSAKPF